MTLVCEYCEKNFSTKYVLKNHQKSAKYCLKYQKKDVEEFHNCSNCGKKFTRKDTLKTHTKTCKMTDINKKLKIKHIKEIKNIKKEYEKRIIKQKDEYEDLYTQKKKYESRIEQYEKRITKQKDEYEELDTQKKQYESRIEQYESRIEQYESRIEQYESRIQNYELKIDKLQEYIKELAEKAIEKPTQQVVKTTTNNTTNNVLKLSPLNLDKEDFSAKIEECYDIEYFLKGKRGVAEFTKDKLLTDEKGKARYICVDPARHIFKYVDENGETHRDVKASKLTSKVTPNIVNKAGKIALKERENKENYKQTVDQITDIFFDIKELDTNPDKLGIELSKITCI